MEQAKSNSDSHKVFTREKRFVRLGMVARGIAWCSMCGADAGAGAQASRLLPSDGNSEVIGSSGNKRACSDGRTDSPIEGCARRDSDFGSDPPAFIKVQGTH